MKRILVTMVEFILEIDSMTTTEFCKEWNVPLPNWTGDVKTSSDKFLQVDAIKSKMFIDYAKFLNKKFTAEDLVKIFGFENLGIFGTLESFKSKNEFVTKGSGGFLLEQPGNTGIRLITIDKVNDLAGLGIEFDLKAITYLAQLKGVK